MRVALGASRSTSSRWWSGKGLRLAIDGPDDWPGWRGVLGALLSTVLFGVGPLDAVTYLAVSSVLLAVAALACLLPALCAAASIDPMTALRTVVGRCSRLAGCSPWIAAGVSHSHLTGSAHAVLRRHPRPSPVDSRQHRR